MPVRLVVGRCRSAGGGGGMRWTSQDASIVRSGREMPSEGAQTVRGFSLEWFLPPVVSSSLPPSLPPSLPLIFNSVHAALRGYRSSLRPASPSGVL